MAIFCRQVRTLFLILFSFAAFQQPLWAAKEALTATLTSNTNELLAHAAITTACTVSAGLTYQWLEEHTSPNVPWLISAGIGFSLNHFYNKPNSGTHLISSLAAGGLVALISKLMFSKHPLLGTNSGGASSYFNNLADPDYRDFRTQPENQNLKEMLKAEYPQLQTYFAMLEAKDITGKTKIGQLTIVGPSGTGKTTLGMKTAEAYGRVFYYCNAQLLMSHFVHGTNNKVDQFIARIDEKIRRGELPEGSIIFIDEGHELTGTESVSIDHSNKDEAYAFTRLVDELVKRRLLLIIASNDPLTKMSEIAKRRLIDRLPIDGAVKTDGGWSITTRYPKQDTRSILLENTVKHVIDATKIYHHKEITIQNFAELKQHIAQYTEGCAQCIVANIAYTIAEAAIVYARQQAQERVEVTVPMDFVHLWTLYYHKHMLEILKSEKAPRLGEARRNDHQLQRLLILLANNNQNQHNQPLSANDQAIQDMTGRIAAYKQLPSVATTLQNISSTSIVNATDPFKAANKYLYQKALFEVQQQP